MTTVLPASCRPRMWAFTASNTLASVARSAAKLWPRFAPMSMTPGAAGTANGDSRASPRSFSRPCHSSTVR